jgi:hypothetical protein
MYDGNGWADNQTIRGWYSCRGQTTPYGNTPNMLNRFIRGAVTNSYGGSNEVSPLPLPQHKHNINNTPVLDSASTPHGHGIYAYMLPGSGYGFTGGNDSFYGGLGPDNATAQRTLAISRISAESHTHSITASIGYAGQGGALDIRPDYYRVIFIIKMV